MNIIKWIKEHRIISAVILVIIAVLTMTIGFRSGAREFSPVNDPVKKGAVLGTVGDTSVRESVSIEGSHIHFEVLKKEGKEYVCVNPTDYLKK